MKRSDKKRIERRMRMIAAYAKGSAKHLESMGLTYTAIANELNKPTKEKVESIVNIIKARTTQRLRAR